MAQSLGYLCFRAHKANEDLRAENRFLDLRRKELAQNIRKRSKVAHIVRQYFHALGE